MNIRVALEGGRPIFVDRDSLTPKCGNIKQAVPRIHKQVADLNDVEDIKSHALVAAEKEFLEVSQADIRELQSVYEADGSDPTVLLEEVLNKLAEFQKQRATVTAKS